MKKLINKMRKIYLRNELFIRIMSVVVISILGVASILSLTIVKISQKTYVQAYVKSNNIILNQVSNDYEELNNNIVSILTNIENSQTVKKYLASAYSSPAEESRTLYDLELQLDDSQLLYKKIPSNMILIGLNGQTFYQNDAVRTRFPEDLLSLKIIQQANEQSNSVFYQFIQSGPSSYTNHINSLAIVKVLKDDQQQTYGYALILLTENVFADFYNSLIDGNLNTVYITNQDQWIVSSNNKKIIGKKIKSATFAKEVSSPIEATTHKNLYGYDFTMTSVIDESQLVKQMVLWPTILAISAIAISFISIFAFLTIRKTTAPIYTLIQRIPHITEGDFSNKIDITGTNEIRQLVSAYNFMLDGLNIYIQQLLNAQNEKRLSEIHALQMQIQPHFIYNTLTSIKFLIWQGDKEKAAEAIDAFIRLLRNTISDEQGSITLAQELSSVMDYVLILQIRFGDNVAVNLHSNEALKNELVPKMIVHPIIENSFIHAFPNHQKGNIEIFALKKEGILKIEIIDNGIGMPETNLSQLSSENYSTRKNQFSGIGLKNVDDRLKLLYGNEYGISVISTINLGTTVTIRFPTK